MTLSSKKAATYFNVNESTVKRWADSGILKCYRTAGGHRKFKLNDLIKYAEDNNFQTAKLLIAENESEISNQSDKSEKKISGSQSKRLERYILSGDQIKSYEFLCTLYIYGYTIEEIFDKVIKEAMRSIGRKWEDKTLGIESEHIATNTIISTLNKFEQILNKKSFNKKTAICAGLENEFHGIGLLCVKIALEADGWNVIYPGVNLPVNSVNDLITKHKPKLLCVSATHIVNIKNYKNNLISLKKNSDKNGSCLIFGGENELIKKLNYTVCNSISDLKERIKLI